jgi:hypothetical protein
MISQGSLRYTLEMVKRMRHPVFSMYKVVVNRLLTIVVRTADTHVLAIRLFLSIPGI